VVADMSQFIMLVPVASVESVKNVNLVPIKNELDVDVLQTLYVPTLFVVSIVVVFASGSAFCPEILKVFED
jgi:hypothetical protein